MLRVFIARLKKNFKIMGILDNKDNRDNTGTDDYRWKILRHRMLIAYRIIIIVVVVLMVIGILAISYHNKLYVGYDVIQENERLDSEDAKYIAYNGNVIKYSQDGAEAFNGNNVALWNITFEMQNPQVNTCGDYAVLGDFKGNLIHVISTNGDQHEIETKDPVSAFCVSERGIVAAVLEADSETKINLYDTEGEVIATMKCTMLKSGYPIDLSISRDGTMLGVAYMRLENGQMKSSVAFYNFGEVGQNEIDNYVSGYDYADTVIPKLQFINDETAFALGNDRFVIYKGEQKPTSYFDTFLTDEVQSVYYSENAIALVYRDSEVAGNYRLDVYDDKGKLKLSQSIDVEYTDIQLVGDRVIVYNDMRCVMYKLNGSLKYDGDFEEPMLLVVPQKGMTKWVLVNRDSVKSVRLQ